MSSIYTPSAAELISLLLPSDGDLRNVASVNGPLKKLGDAVAFLQAHPYILDIATIVDANTDSGTAGTILAPATCTAAILVGWGSGGPGGQGAFSADNLLFPDGAQNIGGGGGGGAQRCFDVVPIVPSTLHSYLVGGSMQHGNDGQGTSFANAAAVTLFRAEGAGKGGEGVAVESVDYRAAAGNTTVGQQLYGFQQGGSSVRRPDIGGWFATRPAFVLPKKSMGIAYHLVAQHGGYGLTANVQNDSGTSYPFGVGGRSSQGYAGGAPGNAGANYDGLNRGGGGGGGGGAGPGGDGGNGGDGGAGMALGAGGVGGNGSNAPVAGSGAGGGGGGGVGGTSDANTIPGTPGTAGRSAGGTLKIIWLKRS